MRGPLSPAESKAALAHLAIGGKQTDIYERHLALEESVRGSPISTRNGVRLLRTGPSTHLAMFEAIHAPAITSMFRPTFSTWLSFHARRATTCASCLPL